MHSTPENTCFVKNRLLGVHRKPEKWRMQRIKTATVILETTWSLNLPGDNYIKIAGTKAGATLNPFMLYTEEDGKELNKQLEAPSINGFDEEVKHFVGCIVDGTEPIPSAEQGVMLMQMLDGIYESSENGQSVNIVEA